MTKAELLKTYRVWDKSDSSDGTTTIEISAHPYYDAIKMRLLVQNFDIELNINSGFSESLIEAIQNSLNDLKSA